MVGWGESKVSQGHGKARAKVSQANPPTPRMGKGAAKKTPRLGERGGEQKTSHSLEGPARIKVSARAHVRAGGRS